MENFGGVDITPYELPSNSDTIDQYFSRVFFNLEERSKSNHLSNKLHKEILYKSTETIQQLDIRFFSEVTSTKDDIRSLDRIFKHLDLQYFLDTYGGYTGIAKSILTNIKHIFPYGDGYFPVLLQKWNNKFIFKNHDGSHRLAAIWSRCVTIDKEWLINCKVTECAFSKYLVDLAINNHFWVFYSNNFFMLHDEMDYITKNFPVIHWRPSLLLNALICK